VVVVLGRRLGFSPALSAVCGGIACLTLRLVSVWLHWQLPGSSAA
jgi:uncharacterized membrane protein YeiH